MLDQGSNLFVLFYGSVHRCTGMTQEQSAENLVGWPVPDRAGNADSPPGALRQLRHIHCARMGWDSNADGRVPGSQRAWLERGAPGDTDARGPRDSRLSSKRRKFQYIIPVLERVLKGRVTRKKW